LIDGGVRKIPNDLYESFNLFVIFEHLPMLYVIRYKGSTPYERNLGGGTLKVLAAIARESTIMFSSLGKNWMLKSMNKLSIKSHTSFHYVLSLGCLAWH